MSIQLEYYKIFAAVAESKSFCKAAEQLYITQPAISQSIKQLETQLDTQLFVRTSRGVILTNEGEMLFSYVERALSMFNSAENYFGELKTLEQGVLNIGASDTLCQHYLLPYLKKYHKIFPKINIRITNRTSGETLELLKKGKVDIGFINMPLETGEHIAVKNLMQLHDCFVCGKGYFEKFKEPVDLEYLTSYQLLMLEQQTATRNYFDSYCKSVGVSLTSQIELGSHDLLLEFAANELGISVVVKEYAKKYLQQNKLREIELKTPIPPRSIALIYRKKIPLSFAAKEFISLL